MAENESTPSEDAPESAPSAPVDHSAELRGFQFVGGVVEDREGLAKELATRSQRFAQSVDDSIVLSSDGVLRWLGDPVGRLVGGEDLLKPRAVLLADDLLEGEAREAVQARLDLWLSAHMQKVLGPLLALAEPGEVADSVKEIGKKVAEALGVLDRERVRNQVKSLDQSARAALRKLGLRFGANYIYVPALLKPGARTLCSQLWGLRRGVDAGAERVLAYAAAGRTSFAAETPLSPDVYRVAGFRLCGERVVRVDIVERLTDLIRAAIPDQMRPGSGQPAETAGFVVTAQMTSLTGCAGEAFASILRSLGFESHKVKKADFEAAHRRPEPAATEPLVPTAAAAVAGESGEAVADEAPGAEARAEESQVEESHAEEVHAEEAHADVSAGEEVVATEAVAASEPVAEATIAAEPVAEAVEPEAAPALEAVADAEVAPAAESSPVEAVSAEADAAPAEEEWIEVWRPAPRPRRHAPPPNDWQPSAGWQRGSRMKSATRWPPCGCARRALWHSMPGVMPSGQRSAGRRRCRPSSARSTASTACRANCST